MWKPWEPSENCCTKEILIESFVITTDTEYYEAEIFEKVKDWSFFKITKDNESDFVTINFYKKIFDEEKYKYEKAKYERDIVEYNKWVANEIETKERKIRSLKYELDRLSKRE